jgi:hypothetical protein
VFVFNRVVCSYLADWSVHIQQVGVFVFNRVVCSYLAGWCVRI